ncbi:DNA polymerase III subunit delta' [Enhydrobacter sp.]|jgi:DNA polymerase-3 subunit delta'|uniref:DNA polymerase III subunit delta' n=1 Tax=Enhydrobacter sp. TaxID=1894999 RepID=UPI00261D85DF|nr:DNA polymerase III subunit delta' [Enhydrobacter sp.]WIM13898.1 MAG: DNA polymerase III delta prime subunit [Enhydrobacter sp.]
MARGKTSTDPAELEKLEWPYDWPPPWRNDRLVGHDAAERAMLAAHRSGHLHHAWLITGPRGIGKATLAWRFARYLLAGGQGGLFGATSDSLDVATDAPGRALIDARTHPDLFHLRRTLDPKADRIRAEIAVGDVRALGEFMHMTPAMGEWRVAIVDPADEMNSAAANAILKILEEPPPNSVLLIVAHAPGRLLPTIRSRCRRLALSPLSDETVVRLLGDYAPAVEREEAEALADLADGSIGRALELANAGSLALYSEMVEVLTTLPDLDMARLHGFAERFARRGEEANADWRSLNYLLDGWLKDLARRAALGGEGTAVVPAERGLQARLLAAASLDRWIEAWEKIAYLLSRADAVNLDRKQTVLVSFLALQSAMR